MLVFAKFLSSLCYLLVVFARRFFSSLCFGSLVFSQNSKRRDLGLNLASLKWVRLRGCGRGLFATFLKSLFSPFLIVASKLLPNYMWFSFILLHQLGLIGRTKGFYFFQNATPVTTYEQNRSLVYRKTPKK